MIAADSVQQAPGAEATGVPRPGPVQVLLVVRELGLGGIERDVTKLALGFDRSRYVPLVCTYQAKGPRFDELSAAGIPILELKFPSLFSPQAARAALKLMSFIRRHRIGLVHAFDPSAVFALPVARLARVPVVLRSQLGHMELYDARTRSNLQSCDRFSDLVVVNCEALKRHLSSGFGVPTQRIEICYNGVQTEAFHPGGAERPPEVGDAPLVIGSVSVLRPEKALHELQQAFARVRHLAPGSKLLIVGSGPELERLEATRAELGLENHCVLLPAVARVENLMRGIDIFVSCSHSEAFSNAILEAMASGCCVIGSRVGGTPELIGADQRGLLFEAGDVGDLAAKLARLMTDTRLRKALAETAAIHDRTNLSVEANVRRTMEIYDTLFVRKRIQRPLAHT